MLLGLAAGAAHRPGRARPGDASPEAGFARDMSTHHAQAVEMGLIAFQQGSDADVRSDRRATSPPRSRARYGMMQGWLRSWELDPTGEQPRMAWMPDGEEMVNGGLMPGMASTEEMERLRTAQGKELDILFLEMMIKHHLGGIHMVDGAARAERPRAGHRGRAADEEHPAEGSDQPPAGAGASAGVTRRPARRPAGER